MQNVNILQDPIIYVSNASGCSPVIQPRRRHLPTTGSNYWGVCGDVYVYGNYSTPLTIGAGNDVIIAKNPTNGATQGVTTSSDGSGNPTGGATLGWSQTSSFASCTAATAT